jgi:hypothetical protein
MPVFEVTFRHDGTGDMVTVTVEADSGLVAGGRAFEQLREERPGPDLHRWGYMGTSFPEAAA